MVSPPSDRDIDAAISDPRRLRAVRASHMLDTPSDEKFDRLTRTAARLIGVPATVISIIADRYDYYKSVSWMGASYDGARHVVGRTFCHYGLLMAGPLVLNDISEHPELRHTSAIDALGVRAYLGVPLITDDGEHIGSFCAVELEPRAWTQRDIDTLREFALSTLREIKLQNTLADYARNLELAKDAVQRHEELVAAIAHDLAGPLQTVSFCAELLQAADLPVPQQRAVERVQHAAETMAESLRAMVNHDQPDSGLVTADFEVVDLLDKVKAMMHDIAQRNHVRLAFSADPNLPPLRVDLADLLRIFGLLIGNAISFSAANGNVHIHAAREQQSMVFSIRDTGGGITPTELALLFERVRLAAPNDLADASDRTGLGQGLAICHALATRHGGRLDAESAMGIGSTFRVTLPVRLGD